MRKDTVQIIHVFYAFVAALILALVIYALVRIGYRVLNRLKRERKTPYDLR